MAYDNKGNYFDESGMRSNPNFVVQQPQGMSPLPETPGSFEVYRRPQPQQPMMPVRDFIPQQPQGMLPAEPPQGTSPPPQDTMPPPQGTLPPQEPSFGYNPYVDLTELFNSLKPRPVSNDQTYRPYRPYYPKQPVTRNPMDIYDDYGNIIGVREIGRPGPNPDDPMQPLTGGPTPLPYAPDKPNPYYNMRPVSPVEPRTGGPGIDGYVDETGMLGARFPDRQPRTGGPMQPQTGGPTPLPYAPDKDNPYNPSYAMDIGQLLAGTGSTNGTGAAAERNAISEINYARQYAPNAGRKPDLDGLLRRYYGK